jgi:hypothetical protein
VVGTVFEPKREKVIGEWRKLHKKKLYNLYSSSGVVGMIKLQRRDG